MFFSAGVPCGSSSVGGRKRGLAITAVGMLIGAAFCSNFGLASSGKVPHYGQIAVIIGFIVVAAIGFTNLQKGDA